MESWKKGQVNFKGRPRAFKRREKKEPDGGKQGKRPTAPFHSDADVNETGSIKQKMKKERAGGIKKVWPARNGVRPAP